MLNSLGDFTTTVQDTRMEEGVEATTKVEEAIITAVIVTITIRVTMLDALALEEGLLATVRAKEIPAVVIAAPLVLEEHSVIAVTPAVAVVTVTPMALEVNPVVTVTPASVTPAVMDLKVLIVAVDLGLIAMAATVGAVGEALNQ